MISNGKLLTILTLSSNALSNINFAWVQPTCSPSDNFNRCLRGQHCESNMCIPDFAQTFDHTAIIKKLSGNTSHQSHRPRIEKRDCVDNCPTTAEMPLGGHVPPNSTVQQSLDGTCGRQNGNTICGHWLNGACCSSYGWCGNTTAHCGMGCQSGPCISLPYLTTTDGNCGARFGGYVCGDWYQGSCCSMFGFCGRSNTHCGGGCQSGACTGPPIVPAPGPKSAPMNSALGRFEVIGQSGVPAMHAALLPNGKVVFLDKVENYTQLKLPNGQYAYSSEYDPASGQLTPLALTTNAFCGGGIQLADGRLMSIGGNGPLSFFDPTVGDGFSGLRYLTRSPTDNSYDGQDWSEPGNKLSSPRWYPSAQIMPDGTVLVASGSLNGNDPSIAANNNPTYEILDRNGLSQGESIHMDILVRNQPYYMYPFVHLLNDGNLFVFVSKQGQIYNPATRSTVKELPDLLGDFRTYPNTGGSVMLPLSSSNNYEPEVLICGGGPYQDITAPTDASCGRIRPLSEHPSWELESMPQGRCMVEGNLLLDGTVLWLNGANRGAQGFELATNPTTDALIYYPNEDLGNRWRVDATSAIPRLYHSISLMLLDGTILVAGSNPLEQPVLQPSASKPWTTEFRVERYTPPYLTGNRDSLRPANLTLGAYNITPGGSNFSISFNFSHTFSPNVKIVLYYAGFVTHSLHMGHRMVYCDYTGLNSNQTLQNLMVKPPMSHNITPPGYYMTFVVVDGIPSIGQMIMVN